MRPNLFSPSFNSHRVIGPGIVSRSLRLDKVLQDPRLSVKVITGPVERCTPFLSGHSTPDTIAEKVKASYESGCRRIDGAIKGYGGCPMAKDDLTGNMATEIMLQYFSKNNIASGIDDVEFGNSVEMAASVFG